MIYFAVIDTETNWSDQVMSIGTVIARSDGFEAVDAKYHILTPECQVGGMFYGALFAATPVSPRICSREEATEELRGWLARFEIRSIFAYNARFDQSHLPELGELDWYDIMALAAYRQHNPRIPPAADCCSTGRLKRGYGVEPMLRLLAGERHYCEIHNALTDALDELRIMKLLGHPLERYQKLEKYTRGTQRGQKGTWPMERPEPMDTFFATRVGEYDAHMLQNVEGCREGYKQMAALIPAHTQCLLDLGCGTGLELDEIFKAFPHIHVTGIDLTRAMLDRLREKHPDRNLHLICGDYFETELGKSRFDCVVSFETLHHFLPERKSVLYRRIREALAPGGVYLECDWMVLTGEEEACWLEEAARLRTLPGMEPELMYHIDIPCTVERQTELLRTAGFPQVSRVFRQGGTTILLAQKETDTGKL